MRKIITVWALMLITTAALLTPASAVWGQTKNRKEREVIQKRRVKSQSMWQHEFLNGEMSKTRTLIRMVVYDGSGRNSDYKEYSVTGSLYLIHEYRYDARGNIIEDVQRDKERRVKFKVAYVYDANGNVTEEILRDVKDRTLGKTNYTYDGEKLTEKIEVDGAGKQRNRWKYEYDENGNQNIMRHYGEEDKLLFKWVYLFDKKNRPYEASAFNPNDTFFSKRSYLYDESGNLIEETEYNSDERPKNKFRYTYEFFDGRNN